jgi:hypothetical protein
MDKGKSKKNLDVVESVGNDGEKYYKCKFCGAVGNWKTFIKERMCCLKQRNERTRT